jgi:outer membrane murein-binding lipoprotein Lpp
MNKTKTIVWLLALCTLIFAGCGSAELEQEIADLKKEITSLKKEKGDLDKQIETLTADKDTAQAEVAAKQTEVDEIQRKLTALEGDYEFANNQSAELEQTMGTLREELVAAKNRILELEQNPVATVATTAAPPALPSTPPVAPSFPTEIPGVPTTTTPSTPPTDFAPPPSPAFTGTAPAIPTTPAAPPPPPPSDIPEGIAPSPLLPSGSSLIINLYVVAQGRQIPLKDTTIYVTEQKPNIAQWGFHLKNPSVSANELRAIEQSLTTSIIHKKVKTDANGMVNISTLKEGTYWVSCASPATTNGLQWSVQHLVQKGQNNLTLSNGNLHP